MTMMMFMLSMAFMLCTLGLSLYRTHFISTLLCIEGMMLVIFTTLSMLTMHQQTTMMITLPIMLLAFSACEASIGLSLLVATSRTHASDHLANLNLLQC